MKLSTFDTLQNVGDSICFPDSYDFEEADRTLFGLQAGQRSAKVLNRLPGMKYLFGTLDDIVTGGSVYGYGWEVLTVHDAGDTVQKYFRPSDRYSMQQLDYKLREDLDALHTHIPEIMLSTTVHGIVDRCGFVEGPFVLVSQQKASRASRNIFDILDAGDSVGDTARADIEKLLEVDDELFVRLGRSIDFMGTDNLRAGDTGLTLIDTSLLDWQNMTAREHAHLDRNVPPSETYHHRREQLLSLVAA